MKCSRLKDDNEFSADSGTASAISTDMSVMDETECRFDINSYHRVYVVNKDTFLYRQKSLSIARKVSYVDGIKQKFNLKKYNIINLI